MIKTHDLQRVFGGRFGRKRIHAVNELTLEIQAGELFGLVGPDGAGKTTTLRMLAGILKPSAGTAKVNSCDIVFQAEEIKHNLGYMPQQFGLYPDLTVDENLNFVCDVFGIVGAERKQRIKELLDFTGLHGFRTRQSKHLSGGMQKKLGLTAALVHQPQLLLLDEPTTGVDPVARREFWDILTGLHTQGSTIIVSTPYMDEAERCNRVGLMYEGTLMVCDNPNNIKNMLPGKILALRAENLIKAENIVKELDGVLDIQTYGDVLNIVVEDETRPKMIETAISKSGLILHSLRPTAPRLEEAFIYFVRQYKRDTAQLAKEKDT